MEKEGEKKTSLVVTVTGCEPAFNLIGSCEDMYIYILRERGKKRVAGKETPLIYKSNGPGIKPGREASLRHYNPDRFDLYLTIIPKALQTPTST